MTDTPRRPVALLLAASLLATLLGCTRTTTTESGATTTAPSTTEAPAPTPEPDVEPVPLDWQPCGEPFECATLAVPLDYDDPDGPTIDLELERQPAQDADERIGSLLMNPGGPGGSGIEYLESVPVDDDVTDVFDLVSWDPRGVGASSPLQCDSTGEADAFRALDSDPDTPKEQADLEAAAKAIADGCAASDLALLENSSVTDTAKDLERIRIALGDPGLSYVGYSYGTLIGQEYARLYPTTVHALVLDGVVDPSESIQQMLRGQADSIDDTFSPHTLAQFDEVMARAERKPLTSSDGREIGPGLVMLAAVAASYYPDGETYLDMATSSALEGDADLLEELALSYSSQGYFTPYLAATCTDSPFAPGIDAWNAFAAELRAESPRFGAPVANELLSCGYWPATSERTPELLTTAGLPPLLVVGTTGDAATPYEDAVRVAQSIPGAALLTLDGAGHTASGKSGCIDDAIAAYLVDLETPPPGTVCEED